jgi:hypothetical protein
MSTATLPAEGARVVIDFTQDGVTTRHFGAVEATYAAEFHGFQLPMVAVRCGDGRRRRVMLSRVTVLPIERRYVVVSFPGAAGGYATDDEVFIGTLADFVSKFGVPEELAAHDHGRVEGRGSDGDEVVVTWYPQD